MKCYKSTAVAFLTILIALPSVCAAYGGPKQEGEIIASIPFDPAINGFGFRNFGPEPDYDELTADDVIRMFGAENVCIEGTTVKDCVLYETADRWITQQIADMSGGHCEGFSVASLRTFMGKPFKGRKNPAAFQPGAVNLFDLKKDQATVNYISFYHTLQYLKEVYEFGGETLEKKPSEILAMIEQSMQSKTPTRMQKDLYTLGIYVVKKGKYSEGHSIVPIAVEDMGDNNYRIHVYDNNYPGQTKYLTMNTKRETWRYHTASNPAATADDYIGTAATHSLSLTRMSDRARPRYECPFCGDDDGGASNDEDAFVVPPSSSPFMYASYTLNPGAAAKPKAPGQDALTITTSGDVDVLVSDPSGKRIGYDVGKKESVNEIPGAVANFIVGDEDADQPPQYIIPVNVANKKPYKVNIHGTDSEYTSYLQIYAAGFVMGFEDISVDKGESLNMTFSQDGRELSFTASADGETPSLYISTDSGKDKPSYDFEIGGISLAAGKTVTIKLDLEKGLLFFKDDDGDQDKYTVKITRTNPDGKVDEFDESDLDIGKDNDYVLNFGTWDGKGPICIKDDSDESKFDKDECHNVDSQKPAAKKPDH